MSKKILLNCPVCGKEFYRWKHQIDARKVCYCSKKCHYEKGETKEDKKARKKLYHQNWRENNRARHNELNTRSEKKIKDAVFALLGNVCVRCGFSDHRALQVDHIYRAKEKHGDHQRAGKSLYAAILRGDKPLSEFQLLCANCNWIKRHENNEHNAIGKA